MNTATFMGAAPTVAPMRVLAHLDAGADHVCVQVRTPDTQCRPVAEWRELASITPALRPRAAL